MTETEYRAFIANERIAAQTALRNLLLAWRRELWPDSWRDPIAEEDARRRLRDELRRDIAVQAYWGITARRPMYGGICGA